MDPHQPPVLPLPIDSGPNSSREDFFLRHPAARAFDTIGQNFKFAPPARKEVPSSFSPDASERGGIKGKSACVLVCEATNPLASKLNTPSVPPVSGPLSPGFLSGNRKRPIETKDSGFPPHNASRPTKRERHTAGSQNSSARPTLIVLDDDDDQSSAPALAPGDGPSSKVRATDIHYSAAQRDKVLRSREDGSHTRKMPSLLLSASSDSSARSSQASERTVPSHNRPMRRRLDRHPAAVASKDKLDPSTPTPSKFDGALDWGRSQRDLLIAMNSLSAEKDTFEQKLIAKELALKAEHHLLEAEREKAAQLEDKIAKNNKEISNIKEKTDGLQKFLNGMGCDYKVLQEKYAKLNALFNEVCNERGNIQRDHEEIRLVVQKLQRDNSELLESVSHTKEMLFKFEKLNETNVYLQQQLSENAGLLAAERDRVQSLELQAREDLNYFRHEIEQKQLLFDITQKNLTDFEKQFSEVDNLGRAIETIKESNSKITEQLVQSLSAKCLQLETNLSTRVHDIKGVIEGAVNKGLESSEERLNGLASIFKKTDIRSDYLEMVNECKKLFDDIVKISAQTHKVASDSAGFGGVFVEHLNSQIHHLESQLEEMRERRSLELAKLAQKEAELDALKHELDEKQSEGLLCNRLESLLQNGNAVLSEKIASLGLSIQNGPGDSSLIAAFNQQVSELNGSLEQITRNFNEHLSEKNRAISRLESQAKSLDFLYSEACEKIASFDKEKTEYISLIGHQRLQERIDLENTANSLRLSETSGLNNRIRSLEVQKERLEAANALLEEKLLARASEGPLRNEEVQTAAAGLEKVTSETSNKGNNLEQGLIELRFRSSMERSLADGKCQRFGTESEQLQQRIEDLQNNLIASNQELIDTQAENKLFRRGLRDAVQTLDASQDTLKILILLAIQGRSEKKSLVARLRNLEDENQRLLGKGVEIFPASKQPRQPRDSLSQSQPPYRSESIRKSGKVKFFESPIMSLTSIGDAPEFQRVQPNDEEVDYQRLAAEILDTDYGERANRKATITEPHIKPIAPRSKPRESRAELGDLGKRYSQALKTLSSLTRKPPITRTKATEDSQNSDEEGYLVLPPMSSPPTSFTPANISNGGDSKLNSAEPGWSALNPRVQSSQTPQAVEKTKVYSGHRSEALGHEAGKQAKPKLARHMDKKARGEDVMTEEFAKEQESGEKGTGVHSSGPFRAVQKQKRALKKH